MTTERVAGIDVARALAIILMIQAHASDAWTAPGFRGSAYQVSRFFATFPLPAFLLLAGTGFTWRLYKAEREREPLGPLKRRLARRGLGLVMTGYLASATYALIDGFSSWGDVLRADVLHVIGLSIALAAWLVPSRPHEGQVVKTFVKRVCLVGVALTLLSPFLPAFDVPFALAVPLGLFVDAAPITRMPLTPIFAWLAVGAAAAYAMKQGQPLSGLRGSSPKRLLQIGLVGLLLFGTGALATPALLHWQAGTFNRQHIAVIANIIDLSGRALLVLVAGCFLAPILPKAACQTLVRFGQGSLIAYVFHLPLVYGRLGSLFHHRLTGFETAVGILLVIPLSYGAVRSWSSVRRRRGTSHG